eukprot:778416-Alexandrium_andersonii.AAC.1
MKEISGLLARSARSPPAGDRPSQPNNTLAEIERGPTFHTYTTTLRVIRRLGGILNPLMTTANTARTQKCHLVVR